VGVCPFFVSLGVSRGEGIRIWNGMGMCGGP